MAQQFGTNTFTHGMVLDFNDLEVSNDVLVNALNATVKTNNGNEGTLQNDMGNAQIGYTKDRNTYYAALSDGYTPIGSVEYGGVIYITSVDSSGNCEIGSLPSPDYGTDYITFEDDSIQYIRLDDSLLTEDKDPVTGKLLYRYAPLYVGRKTINEEEYDVPLNSTYFGYNLLNPVTMLAEQTFDGSVNLILNDGVNKPRIINTGFHVLANETYEIIKRYGSVESNTNRYNLDNEVSFNLQSGLNKDISVISNFTYNGTSLGGQLKVGNYVFYAVTCDKDGNESDIIAESGVISVFLGTDGSPFSAHGGLEDLTTDKIVKLTLSPIDSCYKYIKLYYSRTTAQDLLTANTLVYKIENLYPVTLKDGIYECNISVSGYEETSTATVSDLNIQYFNADCAKASALNNNILFLANIKEYDLSSLEYELLRNISLHIVPKVVVNEEKFNLDSSYLYNKEIAEEQNSYYNSKFIYEKTGYHIGEIYRFGIVYVRSDNSLTDVFNVCGVKELTASSSSPTVFPSSSKYNIANPYFTGSANSYSNDLSDYNTQGVCRISDKYIKSTEETPEPEHLTDILGIQFNTDYLTNLNSDKYKGYFFVRQKRIPTLLALGYATNICEDSYVPSINIGISTLEENATNGNTTSTKGYLYEALAQIGYFRTGNTDTYNNLFPYKRSTRYTLLNNYRRRLFTLTDHCRGYFDKYMGAMDAVVYWWKNYASLKFTSDFWFDGREEYCYGPSENADDYYIIIDSNGDGTTHDKGGSGGDYLVDIIFLTKCKDLNPGTHTSVTSSGVSISELQNLEKLVSYTTTNTSEDTTISGTVTSIMKTETIKGYSKDNEIIYTKVIVTFTVKETSTTESKTTSSNKSSTTTIIYKGSEINDSNIIYTSNSIDESETGTTTATAHSNSDWVSFYDLPRNSIIYKATFYSSSDSKLYEINSDGSLSSSDTDVPSWVNYDGVYYDNAIRISWWNKDYLSDINNGVNGDFERYIKYHQDIVVEKDGTSEAGNGEGYNLIEKASTFDGKYAYEDEDKNDFSSVKINPMLYNSYGVFCPEYELNSPYYNNLFTGLKLIIKTITDSQYLNTKDLNKRWFKYKNTTTNTSKEITARVLSVPEGVSLLKNELEGLDNLGYYIINDSSYFSSKVGDATQVSFKFAGPKFLAYCSPTEITLQSLATKIFGIDLSKILEKTNYGISKNQEWRVSNDRPFNIVRGIYGAYLGVTPTSATDISDKIVNIYIPDYSTDNLKEYFLLRFDDATPYYAISNRFTIDSTPTVCYRGDCYINWYTHRVNRNFNDSTAPYNDTILDVTSLNNNFDKFFDKEYRTFDLSKDAEAAQQINIGDLNAVSLGSWVTFPVRSTMNTALRCEDGSQVSEVLACGHNRTFFPLYSLDAGGSNKIPESMAFNQGYNKSGGERRYENPSLQVWVNTYFKNRVIYSDVKLTGALQDGHRTFLENHYRDYTDEYGEIIKMISFNNNLVLVCEHGVLSVEVNELQLLALGLTANVYLNQNNVLPKNAAVLSNRYGSKWPESIVVTPYYILGVDADSKKIWRCTASQLDIISDNSIESFLNKHLNITNTLEIGTTNIKGFYNAYKDDVMFTLYDVTSDLSITPDKLWSICYNIHNTTWSTFYSWIPILGENIGNNFITTNLLTIEDSTILYFWRHGLSERVPIIGKIKPTTWYGRTDPFEFEFIVRNHPEIHKIFDNLQLLSNKAEPESFHYEIVGLCYDFANRKAEAFYTQELLKNAYGLSNRVDECDIPEFTANINSLYDTQIAFPLYYTRKDVKNQIYDNYRMYTYDSYNFNYLTGTEVVWDELKDEYKLWNHTKGVDMAKEGLLRGNMRYKEDKWDVQINPIYYAKRNTTKEMWANGYPPLFINDVKVNGIDSVYQDVPNNLYINNKFNRQSIKLKDKYIKIRVRYSGNDLALISAINTFYTPSYA